MSSAITCRTFHNRLSKCYYFKEKILYTHTIRLLFTLILKKYEVGGKSILNLYVKEISKKSFTGSKWVTSKDRTEFKIYCANCVRNLDMFIKRFSPEIRVEEFIYKDKIKGTVHGNIPHKNINIQFSFENYAVTQKDLDFYVLNNYIYNQVHGTSRNCLIICLSSDSYFLIEYNNADYTIKRGLLKTIINNKLRRRGEHCLQCKNNCKPLFINGLERIRAII